VWALTLLSVAALFAALAFVTLRARRDGADPYATAVVLVFVGLITLGPFGVRAQVLGWPCIAALLYVLDLEGPAVWWAVPIAIVWANVHASAMAAIPIVWIDAAAAVFLQWRGRRQRAKAELLKPRKKREALPEPSAPGLVLDRNVLYRLLLCVAVPLALLCTPLGVKLPIYAFALVTSPIKAYINEWKPMYATDPYVVLIALPLMVLCAVGWRRLVNERPRDAILVAITAIASILSVRNLPIFSFVAAVPAAMSISLGGSWKEAPLKAVRPIAATIVGIALIPLAAWLGTVVTPGYSIYSPPVNALATLRSQPGEHRLLCASFAWCSSALGTPNVQVFLDSRADPYPLPVWRDYERVTYNYHGWREVLDKYGVNAILADRDPTRSLTLDISQTPPWRQVPVTDACCLLFVRGPAGARP
jgi:hypothetical protein